MPPKEFNPSAQTGKAYIFKDDSGIWNEELILQPIDISTLKKFGFSVDIFESYIAIGAPSEFANGVDAGAVYIFSLSMSGWQEEAKIVSSNISANDKFGTSVSLNATTLIVGCSWRKIKHMSLKEMELFGIKSKL